MIESDISILLQNPPPRNRKNLGKPFLRSVGEGNNLKIFSKVEKIRLQSFLGNLKLISRAL